MADVVDLKGVSDDITMLNMMMPLQESAILEPKIDTDSQAAACKSVPAVGCGQEEEKQAEGAQHQNKTSASFCDELEKLLETGYAELIRTGVAAEHSPDEEDLIGGPFTEVMDETPFPKGMQVFDDDEDDDGALEDDYEVICARDYSSIPAY